MNPDKWALVMGLFFAAFGAGVLFSKTFYGYMLRSFWEPKDAGQWQKGFHKLFFGNETPHALYKWHNGFLSVLMGLFILALYFGVVR